VDHAGGASSGSLGALRRSFASFVLALARRFPRAWTALVRNQVLVLTFVLIAGTALLFYRLFGGNLAQVLVTGLVFGGVYVLGAAGLSLLYGIKKFANFAHGDLLTLGAYSAWFVTAGVGRDVFLGLAVVIGVLATLGLILEAWMFVRLYRGGPVPLLVASLLVHAVIPFVAAGSAAAKAASGATYLGLEPAVVLLGLATAALLLKLVVARRLRGKAPAALLRASLAIEGVVVLAAAAAAVKIGFGAIHIVFAVAFSIAVLAVVGIVLEMMIFRRLEGRGPVPPLIASVGLAIVIQNAISATFGTEFQSLGVPRMENWVTPWFFIHPIKGALVIAVSVASIVFLHVLLTRTTLGKSMRATSDNIDLARASGVSTRNVTLWTWAISCALVAIGGVLLAVVINVRTTLGSDVLLFLFAAVIIGGIGSPYGAMIGGFIVGVIQELSSLLLDWLSRPDVAALEFASAYRPMAAFAVMVIVLLVRPQGLLGVAPRRGTRGATLRARLHRG